MIFSTVIAAGALHARRSPRPADAQILPTTPTGSRLRRLAAALSIAAACAILSTAPAATHATPTQDWRTSSVTSSGQALRLDATRPLARKAPKTRSASGTARPPGAPETFHLAARTVAAVPAPADFRIDAASLDAGRPVSRRDAGRDTGLGTKAPAEPTSVPPAERAAVKVPDGLSVEAPRLVRNPPRSLAGASSLACMAATLYHEARGEPVLGQRAVGAVVLRRAELGRNGGTVCGVIAERGQFSYVRGDRSIPPIKERDAWIRSVALARDVLSSPPPATLSRADYYHDRRVRPGWSGKMRLVARIGDHVFYEDPGRTR